VADSALRRRWADSLQLRFGVKPAAAATLVRDWAEYQWVRTTRPLRTGETVEYEFRASTGERLASGTATLSHALSDLYIDRRP
jgi:hypothetical protein